MGIHLDADELIRKIDKLSQLRELGTAVKAAALHVKGKIAQYPSDAGAHRAQPFRTDKSRRYFFWALRNGMIEVPYRRGQSPGSQALARKWTIQTQNNGTRAIIGNNVTYGPLVQGAKQTGYHAVTGWKTTDTVLAEETATVVNYLMQMLRKIVG